MIFPKPPYGPALDKSALPPLMDAPNPRDLFYQRDRAMLELAYGCGLRAHELASLRVSGLRLDNGYIRVWGKGRKERIVPIGRHAIAAVTEYLRDLRPKLVSQHSGDTLLLSKSGHALSRVEVWRLCKRYFRRVGLPESTVTHDLRRAFASHLLAGGADLESIRLMLGHADLATTQRYLTVSLDQLKSACHRYHPAF